MNQAFKTKSKTHLQTKQKDNGSFGIEPAASRTRKNKHDLHAMLARQVAATRYQIRVEQ